MIIGYKVYHDFDLSKIPTDPKKWEWKEPYPDELINITETELVFLFDSPKTPEQLESEREGALTSDAWELIYKS